MAFFWLDLVPSLAISNKSSNSEAKRNMKSGKKMRERLSAPRILLIAKSLLSSKTSMRRMLDKGDWMRKVILAKVYVCRWHGLR